MRKNIRGFAALAVCGILALSVLGGCSGRESAAPEGSSAAEQQETTSAASSQETGGNDRQTADTAETEADTTEAETGLTEDSVILSIGSAQLGNIFRADDQKELLPAAENITSYPLDCALAYRFMTHSGEDLGGEGNMAFQLDGFETKQLGVIEVPDDITRYGTYEIEVTMTAKAVIDGETQEIAAPPVEYDFSIMNKLDEGEAPNRMIKTNSHLGIKYGSPDAALSLVRDAGFSGIRDELRWQTVEKEEGVYESPEPARDWIPAAEEYGLDRMWILDYGNKLYADQTNAFPEDELFPGYEEAFLNYVDWVSTTYKGRIDYYQFWNEPDVKQFNYYRADAKQYTKMLEKVYETVKNNDPDGKVVGLAVGRDGFHYLRKAVEAGAADYMDAASFQPYQFSGKFSGAEYKETIQKIRDVFAAAGKPDMPLLVTEMGIAAFPEGGKWPDEYTAAAQTIQLWTITVAEKQVDALYAFHYVNPKPDTLWEDAATQESRWGFVNHEKERVPYSAHPAAIAAAAFNKIVGNADMTDSYINDADDKGHQTYVYCLKRESDGRDVLVCWTEYGSETLEIRLGTDSAEAYDLYSNAEGPILAENGVFTLTTSYEPAYLVGDFQDFEVTAP